MAVTHLIVPLLEKVAAAIVARRHLPESTYRLQFHAGFTFRDAADIVPYLHDLGITDCYASPYLKARSGSKHGYDISDHRVLNPEIGSEEDYEGLVQALQAHGMGQILDTVPNHMGIMGNENAWWNDVMENGPSSPYAGFFDIDWDPIKPQLHNKVLLPVLGGPYGEVLESQQIQLSFEGGTFVARYFDHRFPIAPDTFGKVMRHRLEELEKVLGKDAPDFMEYGSILTAISNLPKRSTTVLGKIAERQREKEVIKRRLATLAEGCPSVREFLEENIRFFNGQAGDRRSFDPLDDLLSEQAYRLCFWRVASDEINYRRFFDVNELAALSMEKPEVFAATHGLILRLLREGKITGLRIDHPDGLYDPRQYLERLQQHFVLELARQIFESQPEYREARIEEERLPTENGEASLGNGVARESRPLEWKDLEGPLRSALLEPASSALRQPLYVVVEKILGREEPIPEDWPVNGTTGYEFLNALNGLFVDPTSAKGFSRIYQRFTGEEAPFGDLIYQKKFLILQVSLSSELHMLAHQLDRLSEKNRWSRDFTLNSLRHALREVIACFPVYRSYIAETGIHPRDHLYVQTAVVRARRHNPAISASLFDFVRDMVLLRYPESAGEEDRAEQLRFAGKFQQVTGPVMAKGLEDTAFYVYNRLVSLNEVGGDPGQFGITLAAFHRHNEERQRRQPRGLSALSTHDTKRSEDVRARLNVLSEVPQEWRKRLTRWTRLNKRHRRDLEGLTAPSRNDEYLLYQTLVGAWPLELSGSEAHAEFVSRIQQYMEKAIHEAKVHTSWINPNPAYDEAVNQFIAAILNVRSNKRFFQDFLAFQKQVSHYGLLNSLSQTFLKIVSPGVPDTYQGTELWDFSLVDPDNRRPVDYDLRRRLLIESKAAGPDLAEFVRELTEQKEDGRIKLYLTSRALHCRRDHPGLFSTGEYLPAEVQGSKREHVGAFLRRKQNQWAIAVAPRLLVWLVGRDGGLPLGEEVWQDTILFLPGIAPNRRCRNIFTGEVLTTSERNGQASITLGEVLMHFPVALLIPQE